MVEDWKQRAEKAGASISKYVMDRVEDSIRREEGEKGYLSRLELIERLKKAEEEVRRLTADDRMLRKLAENLDRELKRYRTKPFLAEKFEGVREFDRELIRLLQRGVTVSEEEILRNLGIEASDTELVKAINKQLEILESYGLVSYGRRGWKWIV